MIQWKDNQQKHTKVNKKGEVVYLTYPHLEETETVVHGFKIGRASRRERV